MSVKEFLELFIKELEQNTNLREYHRIINSPKSFLFRKAYVEQRFNYVDKALNDIGGEIWDLGCGYATTSIFLALNGKSITGTTLEFYYDKVSERFDYWSKFGSLDKLKINYENIFDKKVVPGAYEAVLVQDTLHHLEPIDNAIEIISKSLTENGRVVVSEENGNNIIQNAKLYKQRGNKRIKEIYDEKLGKTILLGDENIRSLKKWKQLFAKQGMKINEPATEYIRFYPPNFFREENYYDLIAKEQKIADRNNLLKERMFFGLNYTVSK